MRLRDWSPAVPHVAFAVGSVALAVWYAAFVDMTGTVLTVWTLLPIVLGTAILVAGVQFRRGDPTRAQRRAGTAILAVGGLYGGGFVAFIGYLQSLGGGRLVHPTYMVLMAGFGGVAMATVIAHFYVGYTAQVETARAESARAKRLQKQASVLNRILRHNLRNELQIIDGWLGAVAGQQAVDREEGYRIIRDHVEELQSASERARLIERVLDSDERSVVDLSEAVAEAVESASPAVTVTTDRPATAPALVHPRTAAAIEEAIANANEHNEVDGLELAVSVRRVDDRWIVEISDDGSGIPEVELEALAGDTETALKHGQGLGLYLIQAVVEQSDGELSVETGDGTTIRMALPVAPAATPATGPRARTERPGTGADMTGAGTGRVEDLRAAGLVSGP